MNGDRAEFPKHGWWLSTSGTDRAAKMVGVVPHRGESYDTLRERIHAKIKELKHDKVKPQAA